MQSLQSMKRDEVKELKLSSNMERDMDTLEEVIVKQGKKRPNFMEPEVTPRKLCPLPRPKGRFEQSSNSTKSNPTLIKSMKHAPYGRGTHFRNISL